MIASTTAADLIEALRTIVRTGRGARQAALFGDLPGASVTTLVALDRHGEQRMGELAERVCVDPSVVSRQVATLARSGFVARRPDPVDGRAQLLGITDAGRDAIARYRGEWIGWVAQALEDWDDDDTPSRGVAPSACRRPSADGAGPVPPDTPPPDDARRALTPPAAARRTLEVRGERPWPRLPTGCPTPSPLCYLANPPRTAGG